MSRRLAIGRGALLAIAGAASAVLSMMTPSAAAAVPRACCFPNGTCQILSRTVCEDQQGGTSQAIGTTCEMVTCPISCSAAGPECDGVCPTGQACINPATAHIGEGATTNALPLCVCVPEIPQGGSCVAQPTACAPGLFCEDGVCCDTMCPPPGRCDLPRTMGVCTAVTNPAPVLSSTGLTVVIAVLIGLGGLAFVRRGSHR
jgi:hypothetical protein